MKILIADDDKLIRYSLKSMLAEILNFDFIITEASNGLEMISRCNEHDPDIAFVDIRMPHLNGIDAITECKNVSPNTQFVIITGYSDFDYAKRCISLGVYDYILKPVEAEYLTNIVMKLKEKLSHESTQKNKLFQLYMHDYFLTPSRNDQNSVIHEIELPSDSCYLAFAIFIDCSNDPKIYNEICNDLILNIKSFGNQLVSRSIYFSLIYSPEGFLRLIFQVPLTEADLIKNKLEQLCRKSSSNNCKLYLFYKKHDKINSIYDAYEKIEEYQYIRMGMNPCEAVLIDEIDIEHIEVHFYKNLYSLIIAFLESNEGLYTQKLNSIYRHYCNEETAFPLENISTYIKSVLGIDVSTQSFKEFMKSFISSSDKMYQTLEYKVTDKIDLILDYIQHSFMNDISINQIASKFDLTPNYVSKLFHDKTNTKFIDYLTNIRISNAKKLLISNGDTPIKEIAIMVGYYSPRHFSSSFKKLIGLYPSEYRKNHSVM